MSKKSKYLQKKLEQHCSHCSTVFQLTESHLKLKTKTGINYLCLNNCLTKWNETLQTYHQEQIMLHLTKQEQQADNLAENLEQLKKDSNKH